MRTHWQEPHAMSPVRYRNHDPHPNPGTRRGSGCHPDGYLMTSARRCDTRPARCPSGRAPGRSVPPPRYALAGLATHSFFDRGCRHLHSSRPLSGPPATPARANDPQQVLLFVEASSAIPIQTPIKEPALARGKKELCAVSVCQGDCATTMYPVRCRREPGGSRQPVHHDIIRVVNALAPTTDHTPSSANTLPSTS